MSDITTVNTVANILREAAKTGKFCPPIREIIGLKDIPLAYAIQTANIEKRIAGGARIIGRKIGLTSVAVQKQLGVDQPDYGMLLDDMEILNGGTIAWSELTQPKIEAEIAFVLSKDLPSARIGAADVISAIDYALASLEIVGSRIENWNIRITDTIADNASASHFILGHRPVKISDFDLLNCSMSMEKNGEKVSEGKGSACLGSPINATLWLAQRMASLGQPLRAGDVVLTGAVGPMATVRPGDHIKAVFDVLGEVSVHFGQ